MSHMVNVKENMTNVQGTETKVAVGDSETLTGTKDGYWPDYHKITGNYIA